MPAHDTRTGTTHLITKTRRFYIQKMCQVIYTPSKFSKIYRSLSEKNII